MFDLDHLKKTYFKMAIPVVIGLVITLIYNLVDTYFIAQTNDNAIIAGVSYCGPLFTLLMAFGNIFGQGGGSLVSRLLGKKDTEEIHKVSSFCFYGALITSIVVMALMLIFREQFLYVLGAKKGAEAYSHASDYYIWLAIGAPGIICSFIHGNLIRCEGYANRVMVGHIVGTIVNIILDPIFILAMGMGAKGAAIATIIGYYISTIYFLVLALRKSQYISIKITDIKCKGSFVLSVLGIGVTVAITNIMQTVSNIILNNYLNPFVPVDSTLADPVATMGVVLKVSLIAQLVLSGFSFGSIPVFGYLFGSRNHQKIKELTKFCVLFLGGIGLGITLILGCFAEGICGVFFKSSDSIAMGATMLRWISVGTIFMTMILVITVLFQAGGKTIPALIMSISRQGVIFIIVLVILNQIAGYRGIVATQAVADIISFIIGIGACYFAFGIKKDKETKKEEAITE